jgi:hypothetical protein
MAHPDAVAAIEERLEANWTATPVVGVNTVGTPPSDGSAYVMVDYPFSNTRRMSTGDRIYREEGGFRLVLHAERGIGLAGGLAQSEQLAAIFRDQKFGTGLRVNTLEPDSPIVDDRNDEGVYYLVVTVCRFTFDYVA